jgi:hypothetical protein
MLEGVVGCMRENSGRRSGEPRAHLSSFPSSFLQICAPRLTVIQAGVSSVEFQGIVVYIGMPIIAWRAGRTAIAPVLKTGVRKDLQVRILRSPPLGGLPQGTVYGSLRDSFGRIPRSALAGALALNHFQQLSILSLNCYISYNSTRQTPLVTNT